MNAKDFFGGLAVLTLGVGLSWCAGGDPRAPPPPAPPRSGGQKAATSAARVPSASHGPRDRTCDRGAALVQEQVSSGDSRGSRLLHRRRRTTRSGISPSVFSAAPTSGRRSGTRTSTSRMPTGSTPVTPSSFRRSPSSPIAPAGRVPAAKRACPTRCRETATLDARRRQVRELAREPTSDSRPHRRDDAPVRRVHRLAPTTTSFKVIVE